jgi:hypothetical protein
MQMVKMKNNMLNVCVVLFICLLLLFKLNLKVMSISIAFLYIFTHVCIGYQNPYGLEHGWTWLARLLNKPPKRITPAIIHAFLEVSSLFLV